MKLRHISKSAGVTVLAAATLALAGPAGAGGPPWGPESPPFNIEVILRGVAGGPGFGHVKFRQPNDDSKIVYLDTWVRGLAPNHAYVLQRAVDANLDGICSNTTMWLTLGQGLMPKTILTDEQGTGHEALFRDLATATTGAQFDIHFQVVDAATGLPVLASGCYRFTVDP